MKNTFLAYLTALILIPITGFTQPVRINNSVYQSTIDLLDTINFEIDRAEYSGGKMLIPISIHSDDTIYALDFELRFNFQRLQYDTIYDPTGVIQPFVFLNPADSVLRLTSYNINPYRKDTTVFILRFDVLSLPILPGDIYQVYGFLNGDSCSIGQPAVVFTTVDQFINSNTSSVFPNPVYDKLYVQAPSGGKATIYSMNGSVVFSGDLYPGVTTINSSDWNRGIYFLKFMEGDRLQTVKLVVQ